MFMLFVCLCVFMPCFPIVFCFHLFSIPKQSMYGIFTYIYHQNQPNVGKYTSPMDGIPVPCDHLLLKFAGINAQCHTGETVLMLALKDGQVGSRGPGPNTPGFGGKKRLRNGDTMMGIYKSLSIQVCPDGKGLNLIRILFGWDGIGSLNSREVFGFLGNEI